MLKNLLKTFFGLIFIITLAGIVEAGNLKKTKPITDGFFLSGIDGKLEACDSNETWFFKFAADISDTKARIRAGTSVEFVPSAALEKMVSEVEKNPGNEYRLWGRISKYQGRNFIYLFYYLPISDVNQSEKQKIQPAVNEPNDELPMPENIVAKLKARKVLRTEDLLKGLELKTDCILADRTGFISDEGNNRRVFTLDAIGRNIQKISFDLLPCQVLDSAEQHQASELDPVRFKIAGVVTKYKNKHYLLLESANPVYSHGNFGK